MTEEVTDRTLRYMQEKQGYVDLLTLYLRHWDIQDRVQLDAVVTELKERGWVDLGQEQYNVRLNNKGRELLEKYGSYSSFLRSEKRTQSSRRLRTMFINANTTIVTIISVGTFIIASLSFYYDRKVDRLENENEKLQLIIDSLTTKKPSLQVSEKDSVTN